MLQVRATRAYIAGFGTAGSLLAGAAVVFVLASAVVSFRGWPQLGSLASSPSVVPSPPREHVSTAATRRVVAAVAAQQAALTLATTSPAPRATGLTAVRAAGGSPVTIVSSESPNPPAAPPTVHTPQPCSGSCGGGSTGASGPGTLGGTVQSATGAVGGGVSSSGAGLGSTVTQVTGTLANAVSRVNSSLAGTVNQTGQLLGNTLSGAGGALGSTVSGAGHTVAGLLGGH